MTEMRIGVSLESIIINTIAGCLMDLKDKPEMTYGDKAKVVYDLVRSFDKSEANMTKQEKIREGIAERIYQWYFRNSQLNDLGEWSKVSGASRGLILAITDIVMEYEDSQEVFIAKHGFYSDLMESLVEEIDAPKQRH